MSSPLPLAVTMGDPAGCGPEITRRAWQHRQQLSRPFFVVGDADVIRGADHPAEIIGHPRQAVEVFGRALPVMHIDCPPATPGAPDPASVSATIEAIRRAVETVIAGDAAAIVTNPINKSLLVENGFAFAGHTEFLAHLSDPDSPPHPVMMLVGGGMRIALTTTHLSLRDAIDALDPELIATTARIVATSLAERFSIASPRLALAALNPHGSEGGAFGSEESDILAPSIAILRAEGMEITGPHPTDSLFHHLRQGSHDAAIALFHDQGLIPVKTVDFWNGVNTTLGLSFTRTSPDHGVAYDRAHDARPDSLIAALGLAAGMAD